MLKCGNNFKILTITYNGPTEQDLILANTIIAMCIYLFVYLFDMQNQVFGDVGANLVQRALNGHNVSIITLGAVRFF